MSVLSPNVYIFAHMIIFKILQTIVPYCTVFLCILQLPGLFGAFSSLLYILLIIFLNFWTSSQNSEKLYLWYTLDSVLSIERKLPFEFGQKMFYYLHFKFQRSRRGFDRQYHIIVNNVKLLTEIKFHLVWGKHK